MWLSRISPRAPFFSIGAVGPLSELEMGLILKPELGPSPTFVFEARFRRKAKFTE